MTWIRLRSLLLTACLVALVTAGCSKSNTLLSPTSPSAVPGATAFMADDGSDISTTASSADAFSTLGRGKGGGGGRDDDKRGRHDDDDDDDHDDADHEDGEDDDGDRRGPNRGPGLGHRGMLSGFVTAVDADSLMIRGVDVIVTAETTIRHGHRMLTLADIRVGDHAQARGALSIDRLTLTATEIKVEDTGRDNDDIGDDLDDAEVTGVIAGITSTATCPALTFTVGTTTVTTNGTTEFDGVACAALTNGTVVEVEGARQIDGSILATSVEVEEADDADDAEVEGFVSAPTGTCPDLTFTVGTTVVTTNSATTFTGVACTAIAGGTSVHVEVEGTLQADGSILAASVQLD